MARSFSRKIVQRPIVEKPVNYEKELLEIIRKNKKKPKYVKVGNYERHLKGYAGILFNMHYGSWKNKGVLTDED